MEVMTIFCRILIAISFLQDKKVDIPDLTSTSVYLTHEGRVKLGDLEKAHLRFYTQQVTKKAMGRELRYWTPERING